jgi:uncharacterized protein YcbK (DUF882 family)
MRDVADHDATVRMDVALFNLFYGVQEWARLLGNPAPVLCANSGYRTPRHNAQIEGAVFGSEHKHGSAGDVTMEGVSLRNLKSMFLFFGMGGVGEYPTFIHADVGAVRTWRGRQHPNRHPLVAVN